MSEGALGDTGPSSSDVCSANNIPIVIPASFNEVAFDTDTSAAGYHSSHSGQGPQGNTSSMLDIPVDGFDSFNGGFIDYLDLDAAIHDDPTLLGLTTSFYEESGPITAFSSLGSDRGQPRIPRRQERHTAVETTLNSSQHANPTSAPAYSQAAIGNSSISPLAPKVWEFPYDGGRTTVHVVHHHHVYHHHHVP